MAVINEAYESALVHQTKTLFDAMASLEQSALRIVLVIDDDRHLLGTITDGDLRRAILRGATVDSPLLPHIRREFTAVKEDASRADVLELMHARDVQQIPVLDDTGRLVGLHLFKELLGTIERPNFAVIMAGGLGVRLRPITETIPKPMLLVAGRPILERIVLHLVGFGIRRIFLAVNYLSETIERHFGDGHRFGCTIQYLREDRPLGTCGALSLLPTAPKEPVLTLNGDLITQFDLPGLLAFHEAKSAAATIALHQYTHTVPFGVADAENGELRSLTEKPTMSWKTNAGIYVLNPDLLSRIPKNTEFHMPQLLEDCLSRKERVGAFLLEGEWIDIGRSQELERARGGR